MSDDDFIILAFLCFIFVLGISGILLRRLVRFIILFLSESQVIRGLSILAIFVITLFSLRSSSFLRDVGFYSFVYDELPGRVYSELDLPTWLPEDLVSDYASNVFISVVLIILLYLMIYITLRIFFFIDDRIGRWCDIIIWIFATIGRKILGYISIIVSQLKELYKGFSSTSTSGSVSQTPALRSADSSKKDSD